MTSRLTGTNMDAACVETPPLYFLTDTVDETVDYLVLARPHSKQFAVCLDLHIDVVNHWTLSRAGYCP